jgi:peptide chain release factor 3
VFDLRHDRLIRFAPGEERRTAREDSELIEGIGNPRLDELFPDEVRELRHDIDLLRDASAPFDLGEFLAGKQSPVFFGSGINNFGVQEILQALVEWAPPPQPRDGGNRMVHPAEAPFSGFVFKIQANMDPRHRDRIAFFRVCSGRYAPGMKVKHLRLEREMKIANAQIFMANERVASEEAFSGDIIGIHNHGQLQIGDTLTEGEALGFKGIPYFAPELFRVARSRDPLKSKQLQKGLRELGEEGAIQVFETGMATRCCWARSDNCSSRSSPRGSPANTRSTRSTKMRASRPRAGSASRTRRRAGNSRTSAGSGWAPTSTATSSTSRPAASTCRGRWSAGRR